METPTHQLPPELVEHIVSFFHESPSDLLVCALVSRSCVYPAQSHVFRRISFTVTNNERLWECLRWALDLSPHLIRHVHRLEMNNKGLSTETFTAICNFRFTHLDGVSFPWLLLSPSCLPAVSRILSSPTLRCVRIHYRLTEAMPFSQIWDRCSARLKRLELQINAHSAIDAAPHFTHHIPARIGLESLRITRVSDVRWLTHALQPFDLSGLRFLSMFLRTDVLHSLRSPSFASAMQTIHTLDLVLYASSPRINLALFPSLALLRISSVHSHSSWPDMLAILTTIAPSNRILKIILAATGNGLTQDDFAQLDSLLSELPMQHPLVVEFQMSLPAFVLGELPVSSSKHMIVRTEYDTDWFKNITDMV
ncbi:hypothetical protein C8R44DRAFT_190379 [Mycena epipterygia]|nr:hypothetical protein C8R44DRAFT_190379 [Mycena epipterygia]